jgi:hypothetical protein
MLKILSTLSLIAILSLGHSKPIRMHMPGQLTTGYQISIYVGTPAKLVAQITPDTGSPLTLFPCKSCLNCNSKSNILYDPNRSFTSRMARCVYIYPFRMTSYQFVRTNAKEKPEVANSQQCTDREPRGLAKLFQIR